MLRALEGQSPEQIGEQLALEPATVAAVLRSPLVAMELARLQDRLKADIVEKVKVGAHEALETVTDTMRGDITSELRWKAAKDILDRHPDLKEKGDAKGFGEGLGEAIVRQLAKERRDYEQRQASSAGDENNGGGADPVEGKILEGPGFRSTEQETNSGGSERDEGVGEASGGSREVGVRASQQ